MQFDFKKILPHLGALALFVVGSLIYFNPVLQGKTIFQSDIIQYRGMAKELMDYRETTGEETYWTEAFGGMPTYQLGAKYPHNYIKKLDLTLRFLPRPADYLFLYLIGMYILFLTLKIDYKLAILGAIAFGLSTYLIIILGIGHNAKAHAVAYMPLVLSGIILTFRGNYLWGFLLTSVAVGLELVANHPQMTYYLILVIGCLGVAYLVDAFRKKMLPHFAKASLVLLAAALLGFGLNTTNILATKEYADTSTRGKSELTLSPNGAPKENPDGLDFDYITAYSYGKLESFNLLIPRFMGGGTADPLPEESKAVEELIKLGASPREAQGILSQIPAYWGDQPFVGAPAYVGAVVIFLAVLALFLVKGRFRWWVLASILLSLLLSWGRNLSWLTEFFIDYVPLYDKFRAVSSIQVIIELLLPLLATVGLHQFFNAKQQEASKQKALMYASGIVGGIILIFLLFKSALFDFASPYDSGIREQLGQAFMDAVREDRATLLTQDAIRSLVFVLLAAATLWFLLKQKIKELFAIIALTVLIAVDLIGVNTRYVTNDDFVAKRVMEEPFQKSPADLQILEDEDHFRVFDATTDAFNNGQASYFHNAVGGYHAAKPGRMMDLYEFYIAEGDVGILNMLNVRYIIAQSPNGGAYAQRNPYANGNAWFVDNVIIAENADQEIQQLDSLDTKRTAVIHKDFANLLPTQRITRDSTATIDLVSYQPNKLTYEVATKTDQLAIFSEAYYPHGWKATLNGEDITHFRANYALRAAVIPEGVHQLEFSFEPQVVQTGSTITLASSLVFLLVLLGGIFMSLRKPAPREIDS